MGVLRIRALLLAVYINAPDFWKFPNLLHELDQLGEVVTAGLQEEVPEGFCRRLAYC